jgi:DNA anti-recombination protein RmuC
MKYTLLVILAMVSFSASAQKTPYTVRDKELLIQTSERVKAIDKRFDLIDGRFEQSDKRFDLAEKRLMNAEDRTNNNFIAVLAIFIFVCVAVFGLMYWDRRVTIASFNQKIENIREELQHSREENERLKALLKDFSTLNRDFQEVLSRTSLM